MESQYADLDGTQRTYDNVQGAKKGSAYAAPNGMAPAVYAQMEGAYDATYAQAEDGFGFGNSGGDRTYMTPRHGGNTADRTYMMPARAQDDVYMQPEQVQAIEKTIKPNMTQRLAESLLQQNGMADGLFCLRFSSSNPGCYVLIVAAGGAVKKYPIDKCVYPHEGKLTLLCPGQREVFSSLGELVAHYARAKHGIATRLTRRVDYP
ncbi:hypothetical protein PTSG_06924 [Salpingoeca rosetta]|uniref:SH2 domain-containing protein n=1 Tax=Salpingoeca rosetta (strain ATCC 50818 / BSB-021) TaxID=946362 RepID=F2UF71_SALR5|nr:uncharacterized protein PTSG_06924 [Salpingoeca rosetta]EGD75271.1 hypothetical protein PTSG_06924 [Salpingoeca rosetta]|eukprot:XP_004992324.1 hypothetical protein PTSG_06924 [Salpingoeca rosetta]